VYSKSTEYIESVFRQSWDFFSCDLD